jgi:hypothetical protein
MRLLYEFEHVKIKQVFIATSNRNTVFGLWCVEIERNWMYTRPVLIEQFWCLRWGHVFSNRCSSCTLIPASVLWYATWSINVIEYSQIRFDPGCALKSWSDNKASKISENQKWLLDSWHHHWEAGLIFVDIPPSWSTSMFVFKDVLKTCLDYEKGKCMSMWISRVSCFLWVLFMLYHVSINQREVQ